MAGEYQGEGVGGESLVVGGQPAELPHRARTEIQRVLWYALVLSTLQTALTLVGLVKASDQGLPVAVNLPVALFLSAPACVSCSRMIFRANPDALDWWGLRLLLLGCSMNLLATIYFLVGVLLLPSLIPYSDQIPALSIVFIGVAVTAPGLELVGSVIGLGEIAWGRGRVRRTENIG
jgi:hypothetical protein